MGHKRRGGKFAGRNSGKIKGLGGQGSELLGRREHWKLKERTVEKDGTGNLQVEIVEK